MAKSKPPGNAKILPLHRQPPLKDAEWLSQERRHQVRLWSRGGRYEWPETIEELAHLILESGDLDD